VIHIATENGAQFLGESARTGTISTGEQADPILIKGDPCAKIEDIENVETVFKGGVGYHPGKLAQSARGMVAMR